MNPTRRALLRNIDNQRCAYLIATREPSPITISAEDALKSFEDFNDLDAETITGSNERKGSEMPAERNGEQLVSKPVERHARIQSNLPTSRGAFSTEIENLDKSQRPGLGDDPNRRGGTANMNDLRTDFREPQSELATPETHKVEIHHSTEATEKV